MTAVLHLLPMAAAISLCYGASRYERPRTVLQCAVQVFLQILIGLGIILTGLYVLSWRL